MKSFNLSLSAPRINTESHTHNFSVPALRPGEKTTLRVAIPTIVGNGGAGVLCSVNVSVVEGPDSDIRFSHSSLNLGHMTMDYLIKLLNNIQAASMAKLSFEKRLSLLKDPLSILPFGPNGSGKTTLVGHFVTENDKRFLQTCLGTGGDSAACTLAWKQVLLSGGIRAFNVPGTDQPTAVHNATEPGTDQSTTVHNAPEPQQRYRSHTEAWQEWFEFALQCQIADGTELINTTAYNASDTAQSHSGCNNLVFMMFIEKDAGELPKADQNLYRDVLNLLRKRNIPTLIVVPMGDGEVIGTAKTLAKQYFQTNGLPFFSDNVIGLPYIEVYDDDAVTKCQNADAAFPVYAKAIEMGFDAIVDEPCKMPRWIIDFMFSAPYQRLGLPMICIDSDDIATAVLGIVVLAVILGMPSAVIWKYRETLLHLPKTGLGGGGVTAVLRTSLAGLGRLLQGLANQVPEPAAPAQNQQVAPAPVPAPAAAPTPATPVHEPAVAAPVVDPVAAPTTPVTDGEETDGSEPAAAGEVSA